jgi:uncharacterized protein YdeI (YjbR/CyaY-like superfamily)
MAPNDKLPIVEVPDREAWGRWLEANHASSSGVWLKIAKKGARAEGAATPTHPEALDEALCYGWIDGQGAPFDDGFWLQRFTPRGPRSRWSQRNCRKAEQLIIAGRMRPAGLAAVEAARADGRWEAAYEPQSSASVPDDFRDALERHPEAREFFATLSGARRYAFLYRLHHVKTPAARAKRIASYIELLSQGRTLQ